jgi:hypothetical protein
MVRKIAAATTLVLVVSALAGSLAAQQPRKLNIVTGKLFEGAPVNWGETTCVGGAWLGFYPMICSPGTTRVMLRNAVTGWYITDLAGPAAAYLQTNIVPDGYPKPAGPALFGLNCNLDAATMQGDCWGTVDMPAPGGSWVGAWSGKFDLANLVAKISMTAHGTGELAGRELKLDAMGPATGADFYFLGEIVNR